MVGQPQRVADFVQQNGLEVKGGIPGQVGRIIHPNEVALTGIEVEVDVATEPCTTQPATGGRWGCEGVGLETVGKLTESLRPWRQ